MRHVFILNPCAGKKQTALTLREQIVAYFAAHPQEEYSIRLTDGVGAATRIAQEECAKEDAVRLYACGGDGTLQETASGIPLYSAAQLTVVPCGSGNDYVRTFGGAEGFLDLPSLIEGEEVLVDAVDCDGKLSLNIAAIGMDAKVAAKMNRYKHLPGVNGSLAYNLAIVDVFCHPIGDEMDIVIASENGTVERKGKYFLALAANGQYYGGGYHGAPHAIENDGLLDFVLVKKISRFRVLPFLKKYKAGDYDDLSYCEHIRGTAMTVTAKKDTYCTVDGECTCQNRMTFSILPSAYRFVVPRSVALRRNTTTNSTNADKVGASL